MTRTKPAAEFPFRATLQRLRKKKKMTQHQVAEKLGVSSVTVSGWELGRRVPEPHMLPRIAQLFGTTVDNLLGYSKTAESFKAGDVVYVPMYESVAILEGRLAFLDFHGTYPVPAESATVPRGVQAVLIAVPDSSMAPVGIGKGCMLLTQVNAKVNPGDICLSIVDKIELRVRYCQEVQADLVVLKTAGEGNPQEIFSAADRENIHVVGPCVALYQQLPRGLELK
jgi:transcriptional regulator with XRE-family HTH domain